MFILRLWWRGPRARHTPRARPRIPAALPRPVLPQAEKKRISSFTHAKAWPRSPPRSPPAATPASSAAAPPARRATRSPRCSAVAYAQGACNCGGRLKRTVSGPSPPLPPVCRLAPPPLRQCARAHAHAQLPRLQLSTGKRNAAPRLVRTCAPQSPGLVMRSGRWCLYRHCPRLWIPSLKFAGDDFTSKATALPSARRVDARLGHRRRHSCWHCKDKGSVTRDLPRLTRAIFICTSSSSSSRRIRPRVDG